MDQTQNKGRSNRSQFGFLKMKTGLKSKKCWLQGSSGGIWPDLPLEVGSLLTWVMSPMAFSTSLWIPAKQRSRSFSGHPVLFLCYAMTLLLPNIQPEPPKLQPLPFLVSSGTSKSWALWSLWHCFKISVPATLKSLINPLYSEDLCFKIISLRGGDWGLPRHTPAIKLFQSAALY